MKNEFHVMINNFVSHQDEIIIFYKTNIHLNYQKWFEQFSDHLGKNEKSHEQMLQQAKMLLIQLANNCKTNNNTLQDLEGRLTNLKKIANDRKHKKEKEKLNPIATMNNMFKNKFKTIEKAKNVNSTEDKYNFCQETFVVRSSIILE